MRFEDAHVPAARYVDWMSILIEMDKEKLEYVDYVFMCDVYGQDPRHEKRRMVVGQNRGLFRVNKSTLDAELLLAMDGDDDGKRFIRAVSKVLREQKATNEFPKKAHFACG